MKVLYFKSTSILMLSLIFLNISAIFNPTTNLKIVNENEKHDQIFIFVLKPGAPIPSKIAATGNWLFLQGILKNKTLTKKLDQSKWPNKVDIAALVYKPNASTLEQISRLSEVTIKSARLLSSPNVTLTIKPDNMLSLVQ